MRIVKEKKKFLKVFTTLSIHILTRILQTNFNE